MALTFKKGKISPFQKLKFSIKVLKTLLSHGPDEKPFRTSLQISDETRISPDRVEDVLFELEKNNLVIKVERETEKYFQSARDSKELNVVYVIENLLGKDESPLEKDEIDQWLEQLKNDMHSSKGNVYLRG